MQKHHFIKRPTKEEMRELPKFEGMPIENILVIQTIDDIRFAHNEICKSTHVGFDTESKPNFVANQPKTGPHVVQLATQQHAFLFRPSHKPSNELLTEVIQSEQITKVGFGLKSDRTPIYRALGVKLRSTLELAAIVRRLGYQDQVGLKSAVAIVLNQYLQKSKSTTTSNWGAESLSERQMLYAANDAYASLQIYYKLTKAANHLL